MANSAELMNWRVIFTANSLEHMNWRVILTAISLEQLSWRVILITDSPNCPDLDTVTVSKYGSSTLPRPGTIPDHLYWSGIVPGLE